MSDYAQITVIRRWVYTGNRFNKAEQHVLKPYFESAAFFSRKWDIYHYETSNKDFFLVPCTQVMSLFNQVSKVTGFTKHLIDVTPRHIGFRIDPEAPYELPGFIGVSTSKTDYDQLVAEYGWDSVDRPVKDKKNAKKKKAQKQKVRKTLAEASWRAQVGCARRYLGLGAFEHVEPGEPPIAIGYDGPPVVFVAVDVEAYEKDHNCITEIGISSLDTLKIKIREADFNPSTEAKGPKTYSDYLFSLVDAKHLRIQEYRSLRNGLFVKDNADNFEFGQSKFVPLCDIPATIAKSFRIFDAEDNRRKVVLVGHDIRQDMTYLRKVGYDVWNNRDLEVLDTAQMFKAISEDVDNRSLARVLTHFEVIFWNLHNAGNDAAYTLQAFLEMACAGVRKLEYSPPTSNADYDDLVEQGCIQYLDRETLTIAAYADDMMADPPKPASTIKTGWESDTEDEKNSLKGGLEKLNISEEDAREVASWW